MTWNIRFGVARADFFGDGCGDRVVFTKDEVTAALESLAKKINVEGWKYVIKKILNNKKKIILLSSSAVFNGKKKFYIEDDYRKPINNYGKYKKEIEEYIKKYSKNYLK